MQQVHKGLCKHQGKARTARVPAQKLAAPKQNQLLPPLAQAPVRTQAAGAASPQPRALPAKGVVFSPAM